MDFSLTERQEELKAEFRRFTDSSIVPFADDWDASEKISIDIIAEMRRRGYWGASLNDALDDQGMNRFVLGLLLEEIGRGSASLLSLITVHTMVCQAVAKWGNPDQTAYWLPRLASGETLAAFGLTEPDVGSDAREVKTEAGISQDGFRLNGAKEWISGSQIADLFLIIASCEGEPAAFLIPGDAEGMTIEPIRGMLGFRSAMMAKIRFDDCRLPKESLLGRIGTGFSHVASTALDYGRYCIAWGCVGLAQACISASLSYSGERRQFGRLLNEHQLIQRKIAEMITGTKAARLLCCQAGFLRDAGDPGMIMEASAAKYFASRNALRAALDAVQIQGARGCSSDSPVQRYLRDAKIMEIIEGSSQILQIMIARHPGFDSW